MAASLPTQIVFNHCYKVRLKTSTKQKFEVHKKKAFVLFPSFPAPPFTPVSQSVCILTKVPQIHLERGINKSNDHRF